MTHEFNNLIDSAAFRMKLNEVRLAEKYKNRSQDIKVSVIMPTWNRSFIIQKAIDSVLTQSYRNFELIISDDGSIDNTEDVITAAYGREERIRYIKNTHIGVGHARNAALELSQGELIAYLDSDNVWAEHYLLIMVNTFLDFPEIQTLYCAMRYIDEPTNNDYILFREYDRERLLQRNFIDINTFMHRKTLLDKLNGFNNEFNGLEDWELVLRFTRDRAPKELGCCLATYQRRNSLNNLTLTKDLRHIYKNIRDMYKA
jgi:glycosyltransferase involved in cell wall biosynthesis